MRPSFIILSALLLTTTSTVAKPIPSFQLEETLERRDKTSQSGGDTTSQAGSKTSQAGADGTNQSGAKTTPAAPATTSQAGADDFTPPRTLNPSDPPTAEDVVNAISNWGTDIETVNVYLNTPTAGLNLNKAIAYAQNEPLQLATLMKVTELSTAGQNAAQLIAANFPIIPDDLEAISSGSTTTDAGLAAINSVRCCTVLPAIGTLWTAAAKASNAGITPSAPQRANACASITCTSSS